MIDAKSDSSEGLTAQNIGTFFQSIGTEFLEGIIKANYRDVAIDEVLPLVQTPLPNPQLPLSTQHPRLLFSPNKASQIRLRRYQYPYTHWANQIIARAETNSRNPASPLLNESERSEIAKSNAFAYFLTSRKEFRKAAVIALENIREPEKISTIEGGKMHVGWGDWLQAATSLRNYCVAYDLIAAELSSNDRQRIQQKLAAETDEISKYFVLMPKNNHATVISIGIATVALTISHPKSQRWFDVAMEQLSSSLSMIENDGSYREGAYYARFIASHLYPFAFYLYNVTGENLFEHPKLINFNRWLIDLEKPDGTISLFDDAFPESLLYQPIGVGLAHHSGELRYRFEANPARYDDGNLNWIESFCAFDSRIQPEKPDYRSATFYPDGGMAIFRNESQIYGLLLSQSENFSNHDHIEPTAFTLTAFGKDLLIDAGYGEKGVDDPNRAYFTSAQSQNMPLVNGLGPDQNPVFGDNLSGELIDFFETEPISAAAVKAGYRDAHIQRNVLFVGNRYFLVFDEFSAPQKKHFSVPWHALGDFRHSQKNRVSWSQTDIRLDLEFLTHDENPLFITPKTGLHTHKIDNYSHTSAVVNLPYSRNSHLISILLPQKIYHDELTSQSVPMIGDGNARVIRAENEDWKDHIVTAASHWQCHIYESDAKMATFRQNGFGEVEFCVVKNATYLKIDGKPIFESDSPISVTLILNDDDWFGYLSEDSELPAEIRFFSPTTPTIVMVDKKMAEFESEKKYFTLFAKNAGILEIGNLGKEIRTTPSIKENLSMMKRLNRCDRDYEGLSEAEKTQLRNEIIQVIGETGIKLSDSVLQKKWNLENGTSKIYGISSGILNSLYNPTGVAELNLPQIFEWERSGQNHEIRYYEEGFLTERGLESRRHQFYINQNNHRNLWLSYETAFDNHQHGYGEFNSKRFTIRTNVEKWQEDSGYQVELTHRHAHGWLSLQRSQSLDKNQINSFSCKYKRLLTNLAVNQPRDSVAVIALNFQKTFDNFASELNLKTRETDALTDISYSQLWQISHHFAAEHRFHQTKQHSDWNRCLSALFWIDFSQFNGHISAKRGQTGKLVSSWQGAYSKNNWRFRSSGKIKRNFVSGDIGLARRNRNFSWETVLQRGETGIFHIALKTTPKLSSTFRANYQIDREKFQEIGLGMYYHGIQSIGGEVRLISQNAHDFIGITGVLGVCLPTGDYLHIHADSAVDENGDMETYKIQITQSGTPVTPGILFSKDAGNFRRFEGYVAFSF